MHEVQRAISNALVMRSLCSLGSQCPVAENPIHQDLSQCSVVSALTEALHRYFKYDDFRPGQLSSTVAHESNEQLNSKNFDGP